MILHLCVILFTWGEGGLCQGDPPGQRPPPWTETYPPGQRPPPWTETWTETPPYGNERAVRILLECILISQYFS